MVPSLLNEVVKVDAKSNQFVDEENFSSPLLSRLVACALLGGEEGVGRSQLFEHQSVVCGDVVDVLGGAASDVRFPYT
jgi:hypothetical protein